MRKTTELSDTEKVTVSKQWQRHKKKFFKGKDIVSGLELEEEKRKWLLKKGIEL